MHSVSILGCGWLGKSLAISFIESGYHVKGSTTTLSKIADLEALGVETFLVDIEDFEDFEEFLASDILVVAITSKNIVAFKRFIEQVESSTIQKVVFISSTSVYPSLNKVMTEEDSVEGNALSRIEHLFRDSTFFETTVLRFAGLYGEDRHPANWFQGRKIPHPEGYVNMIHREDCIEIIHELINQNCWNETFNACVNHHPKRRVFYTNAKLNKGMSVPEFIEDKPLEWKVVSPTKLLEKLNYKFIHNNLLDLKS